MAKNRLHNATRKKAMLQALEKSLGIVTTAAKSIGIERSTHYEWIKKDPEYAEAVKNLDEVVLDFAESKLHKLVDNLNPAAVIFYLKTKGRKRGYIEYNEFLKAQKSNDGQTIEIQRVYVGANNIPLFVDEQIDTSLQKDE